MRYFLARNVFAVVFVLVLRNRLIVSYSDINLGEKENRDIPKCPEGYMYPIPGGNFKFCNCDMYTSNLPAVFYNFSILPDPVVMKYPDFNITFSGKFTSEEMIGTSPDLELSLSLRLIRPDRTEFELCTILPADVCYIPDLCNQLVKRKYFFTCPFHETKGIMLIVPITIRELRSPPFYLQGRFFMKAVLKEAGRPMACLQFEFCINACEPRVKGEL